MQNLSFQTTAEI